MKKYLISLMLLLSIHSFSDTCLVAYADTPYQLENKINDLIINKQVKQIQVFFANGKYTAFIIIDEENATYRKVTY